MFVFHADERTDYVKITACLMRSEREAAFYQRATGPVYWASFSAGGYCRL